MPYASAGQAVKLEAPQTGMHLRQDQVKWGIPPLAPERPPAGEDEGDLSPRKRGEKRRAEHWMRSDADAGSCSSHEPDADRGRPCGKLKPGGVQMSGWIRPGYLARLLADGVEEGRIPPPWLSLHSPSAGAASAASFPAAPFEFAARLEGEGEGQDEEERFFETAAFAEDEALSDRGQGPPAAEAGRCERRSGAGSEGRRGGGRRSRVGALDAWIERARVALGSPDPALDREAIAATAAELAALRDDAATRPGTHVAFKASIMCMRRLLASPAAAARACLETTAA